ncbi:hypothetical protein L1987_53807 [Smallanthus sonchifolius]|uniref:Uncharacterized protein n=1 Tax=Smallanthus sonchifolius TaxID=185202 RepID=A0ACB9EXP7_9ASTR|nr:hypothetical protein L1987_53807 [Smallanthus sonchifolius]
MIEFLKARGVNGKRLGPMSFMNLQALYFKVKKEEEERLGKKGSKNRVTNPEDERKPKKPKPSPSSTTSSIQQHSTLHPRLPSSPPTKSKSSYPAPTHQQPPKKKTKPTTKREDSRETVIWFYSTQDQWFEVFRGRTEVRRSIYTSVDEVMQLPDQELRRMMELGEAHEPENEGGRHLLLVIKHHFNPSKDVIVDAKPIQSHSPFISWSYNAEKDEFTLTDVKGQKMRCSSKAIFKMPSKDIKTLSELPLNNPSKDPRGYEANHQQLWIVDSCCGSSTLLLIAISDEDQSLLLTSLAKATTPLATFCYSSDTPHAEGKLLVQTIKNNNALLQACKQ